MSTDVCREFLGWTADAPATVAVWLIDRASGSVADLSETTLVVPGSRAGRMVLGALVDVAASRDSSVVPPRIITPGHVASLLAPVDSDVAGALERRLVWGEVIAHAPDELLDVIAPARPPSARETWRAGLARWLESTHESLAAGMLTFAAAATRAEKEGIDDPRWAALATLELEYARTLDDYALVDPSLDFAARLAEAPEFKGVLVLAGVVESTEVVRACVERVGPRATALVLSPAELKDFFDDIGRVRTPAWMNPRPVISPAQVAVVDSPTGAARAALGFVAAAGPVDPADVLIVANEAVVAGAIEVEAQLCGAHAHVASGQALTTSRIGSLLEAALDWSIDPSPASFATLVLHPTMAPVLSAASISVRRLIRAIDGFAADTAGGRDFAAPVLVGGDAQDRAIIESARLAIDEAVRPLIAAPSTSSATEHATCLADAISTLLGAENYEMEFASRDAASLRAVRDALDAIGRCEGIKIDRATAIRAVIDALAESSTPDEPLPNDLEVVGWLETVFDPASVLVVTSMDEGVIPAATSSDGLLTESIREAWTLGTTRDRAARDAWILESVARTRARVLFLTTRLDLAGEHRLPSRLLFTRSIDGPAAAASRLLAPNQPPRSVALRGAEEPVSTADASAFIVMPRREKYEPPTRISVTAFRTFMSSPYQFYLESILRLAEYETPEPEIGPSGFGNLIHDALAGFAASSEKDSEDKSVIRDCVLNIFDRIAIEQFGDNAPIEVWLQCELARRRLRRFAEVQAVHRAQGWKIRHAEWTPPGEITLDDVEPTISISGKIDRIDSNGSGEWMIIDYKTGKSEEPDKTHRTKSTGEWTDLQLPLYAHLVRAAGLIDASVHPKLAYFNLPDDPVDAGLKIATWNEADIQSAHTLAIEIVAQVRRGEVFELENPTRTEGVLGSLMGFGIPPSGDEAEEGEADA